MLRAEERDRESAAGQSGSERGGQLAKVQLELHVSFKPALGDSSLLTTVKLEQRHVRRGLTENRRQRSMYSKVKREEEDPPAPPAFAAARLAGAEPSYSSTPAS